MLAFPSPGGDVLRLGIRRSTETVLSVSVPWRGCVASYRRTNHTEVVDSFRPLAGMCCVSVSDTMVFVTSSFRPLAGMCCVAAREKRPSAGRKPFPSPGGDVLRPRRRRVMQLSTLFPSPGGDVLRQMRRCARPGDLVFPSPGGDVLRHFGFSATFPARQRFRPLAGMCCVPGAISQ